MQRIVVSDTTAITHLAKIRLLHILQGLYEEILIPEAVHKELSQVNPGQVGALQVLNAKWIKVVAVKDKLLVSRLRTSLDPGESEAIALAVEKGANVLIIDEVKGRQVARQLLPKIIGMGGILIEAKRAGIIESVKPHLLNLKATDFRMSDQLVEVILKEAGEAMMGNSAGASGKP